MEVVGHEATPLELVAEALPLDGASVGGPDEAGGPELPDDDGTSDGGVVGGGGVGLGFCGGGAGMGTGTVLGAFWNEGGTSTSLPVVCAAVILMAGACDDSVVAPLAGGAVDDAADCGSGSVMSCAPGSVTSCGPAFATLGVTLG